METILRKLQNLSESDFYPYHMPGHKRNGNSVFSLDITEIDDFDNLHHSTGLISEAQKRAAALYGAQESFYLINGSTVGLLSAICASFDRGDRVLVARNCHKAVYHALEIRGIEPIYLYPEINEEYDISVGITVAQVRQCVEEADQNTEVLSGDGDKNINGTIKGMILTSPTYEGLISEIKEIAEYLHQKDMLLIVDEAHGAHFGFHPAYPVSAVTQGADIVIQSLHKTLPSMTQTALLHRCSERVSRANLQKYLGIFQTSSPSYVFMAYMDECICLLRDKKEELFRAFYEELVQFYEQCRSLKNIKVYQPEMVEIRGDDGKEPVKKFCSDPGKIVISAGHLSGKELYNILRQRFLLQPEMCAGNYVLAIMTICDTHEGYRRLYEALEQLDRESLTQEKQKDTINTQKTLASLLKERPVRKYPSWEAEALEGETLDLGLAAGRVSKEYIYLYPPGIPFIVPGEVIDNKVLEGLLSLQLAGYGLQGMADETGDKITVVKQFDGQEL